MATKKTKARKKVTKKKGRPKGAKTTKPVVTQKRLESIREDLELASSVLGGALKKADELGLGDREDTRRIRQQINNALLRCDAATDELSK